MKTLTIIAILFCFGCATPPTAPNLTQLTLDSVDRLMTGRAGTGPTADQINQQFADYDKARAEYENSASYKLKVAAVTPLIVLGGAAKDVPYCSGYRGSSRYGCGVPSKAIVTTTPTPGGGTRSTIKWYR